MPRYSFEKPKQAAKGGKVLESDSEPDEEGVTRRLALGQKEIHSDLDEEA
jgi:hypothetical protein